MTNSIVDQPKHAHKRGSLLQRLRRDQRGNVIGIMAASVVPLAAMIGGGLDMSRIYLVKTRLQQACDAGALSGRREMGSNAWTANSYRARLTAERMFDANFADGAYGSYAKAESGKSAGERLTRSFTESNGKVTGTASATLPMTLMKIFDQDDRNITVTCDAEMRISNTDVMFVLDVTGSMNCVAGDTSCTNNGNVPASGAKLFGLRTATKCFYEALAKQNTSADCGSTPSGEDLSAVQLRFGFMPYSSLVNVGRLLPHNAMANSWTYQSRQPMTRTVPDVAPSGEPYRHDTDTYNYVYNSWQLREQFSNVSSSAACEALEPDTTLGENDPWSSNYGTRRVTSPAPGYDEWRRNRRVRNAFEYDAIYESGPRRCSIYRRSFRYTFEEIWREALVAVTRQEAFWRYAPRALDVSGLKRADGGYNSTVSLPLGISGGPTIVPWDGCIEERQTIRDNDTNAFNNWNPIPEAAYDMDIDRAPNMSDPATLWAPVLPVAVWGRHDSSGDRTTAALDSTAELSRRWSGYACPRAAAKLQSWTATGFENYVDSLNASGNTYHDIGLIWGARLASPTGLFASENARTPRGGSIERHMIFMTDGDTMAGANNYTAYGINWWDRRQTSFEPDDSYLTNNVNARTEALCRAIKNKGITLWVVSYGGGVSTATENRLRTCASDANKYKQATSAAELTAEFKKIAESISALRLTN